MELRKANIIVTGSRGLIGQAVYRELLEHDAIVYEFDLPEEDITDINSILQYFITYFGGGKRLHGLVNCAALNPQPGEAAAFQTLFDVNVGGQWNMIKHALPHMRQGSVVNFGSLYGVVAADPAIYREAGVCMKPLGYTVCKHAIHGLTKQLAINHAPDIRFNTLSPGGVFNLGDPQPVDFQRAYCKRVPMRCMARVSDIVHGVIFLLENYYITGHNLVIDGGYSAL